MYCRSDIINDKHTVHSVVYPLQNTYSSHLCCTKIHPGKGVGPIDNSPFHFAPPLAPNQSATNKASPAIYSNQKSVSNIELVNPRVWGVVHAHFG